MWFTPVIPALWEAEAGGSRDQEFETSLANIVKHPSLLKTQKLARCGGTHLQSQLLGRLRRENCLNPGGRGCNELRPHHCTLAWATERDSVSKKKEETKNNFLIKICKIPCEIKWHEDNSEKTVAITHKNEGCDANIAGYT